MENFIALPNIVGSSNANYTTVALFNSCRPLEKDEKGKFVTIAVEPYKNGVKTKKHYL